MSYAEKIETLVAERDAARKDTARLAWLLMEECVPEGFVHVSTDRYEYAMRVAAEAGRDEPTDADCLDGLRRLIDAAMVAPTDVFVRPNVI